MHELGVLRHIAETVNKIAIQNQVKKVKYITLEVGEASGFIPHYLTKLFPIAKNTYSVLKKAELKISVVQGKNLFIKDIGC